MPQIVLVHWKPQEAAEKISALESAGYEVSLAPAPGPAFLKDLEAHNPTAILIDLSRLPSQGRDLAVTVRLRKGTRHIPIVFAGGEAAKVEQIKSLLPDALFLSWEDLPAGLPAINQAGSATTVVPASVFAAYSGKALADKLGIRPKTRLAHIGSPQDFVAALNPLPSAVTLTTDPAEAVDLVVWFVPSQQSLMEDLNAIIAAAQHAPVWIAWPKKGARRQSDLTQPMVRKIAMDAGLVDYKICSIDQDWSALLFKWRGLAGG